MDMTKYKNKSLLTAIAVFLFSFMRIIALTGHNQLGIKLYEDYMKTEPSNILFWFLAIAFSVLLSCLINRFIKENGKLAMALCTIILIDPLFCSVQRNNMMLLVSVLFILFVLNDTYEKPILNRDFVFVLFVIISMLVSPLSKFSFIPLAIILYFLPMFANNNKKSSTKSYVMVICVVASVSIGIVLSKIVFDRCGTPDKWQYFKMFESPVHSSALFYYVLAVPSVIILFCMFSIFYKKCHHKQKSGSSINLDMIFSLVLLAIGFSFVASIFVERACICTVGIMTPLVFLLMLQHRNEFAKETTKEINIFIKNHLFAVIIVVAVVYYFSIRLLLTFYFQDCFAEYFIVNK